MSELTVATQTQLIEQLVANLTRQGLSVEVRETHISWVILTDKHAWKIKKAVDFGFLDFSTLEKRRHFCQQELKLNRRYAPTLYLDVLPIVGPLKHATFATHGPAIEYAVYMLRFDESGLLSSLADRGALEQVHVDAMAVALAKYHQIAPQAETDTRWGAPDQVYQWLDESILHLKRLVSTPNRHTQLTQINHRCEQLFQDLRAVVQARKLNGYVRDCHGDLHLGNMVWLDEALVLFDCIEFNPALRWIDIMSESAFVMMDLLGRGYPEFAWRFINQYLMDTGDYAGTTMLRFYIIYRALVRAKVALLQHAETETPPARLEPLWQQALGYLDLAQNWQQQNRAVLMIMHGLSASGKSTTAAQLAQQYGCFHLRSDIERKRLHGLSAHADSHSSTGAGIYSPGATAQTYQQLYSLAKMLLEGDFPVIVDATFIKQTDRNRFQSLALRLNCPFLIIHCEAQKAELASRLNTRLAQQTDASEATLSVLEQQIKQQDILTDQELFITVSQSKTTELPNEIKAILKPR